MKIIVPPIVRPVRLTDYAPELVREDGAPVTVHVWVNPPVKLIDEYRQLSLQAKALREQLQAAQPDDDLREIGAQLIAIGERFAQWYAEIWSKHADAGTHWTPQDVRDLAINDTDPGLDDWLRGQTWELIAAHRTGEKKASTAR